MCDTIVATGSVTKDGVTLFGKNSDREPNEAQYIFQMPAMEYPAGSQVQCTYLTIPQARKTHAVLLSRPFWMWGAEMGANEFGLTIGNEAVFTRIPCNKTSGLTGMDLIRLALERCETARQAVTLITDLIETHGQGGNCGYQNKMFYHNSFILADPEEVWLLETADRHWAAKKITGIYAISNRLTIHDKWDIASKDLVSYAIQKKWCKSESNFSFARCYSDILFTGFSFSRYRQHRALHLLGSRLNRITIEDIAEILRDHGDAGPEWRPDRELARSHICNHAGFGPVRISQTTGSMISRLTKENAVHFVTATAAPCTSIFKPIWVDTEFPPEYKAPSRYFDKEVLFWNHELLHRALLNDYQPMLSNYSKERDSLENDFFTNAIPETEKDAGSRKQFVTDCYRRSTESEKKWIMQLQNQDVTRKSGWLYSAAWKKHSQQAQFPMP